jgi:hypothetical protein
MVIVAALAHGQQRCPDGLGRTYGHIIGTIAKLVGNTVDQPSCMQGETIAEQGTRVEGNQGRLGPEEDGHNRGHQKAQNQHQWKIVTENLELKEIRVLLMERIGGDTGVESAAKDRHKGRKDPRWRHGF